MPVAKLPAVQVPDGSLEDKVSYLTDLIAQYKKNLEYYINNIDMENIPHFSKAIIDNLKSISIEAENLLITDGDEARVYFDGNTITMQVFEDGEWVNKVYFDTATGQYIFDGVLSADVINALNALITPTIYADKAYIAEILVDQLETSDKIERYKNSDTSMMSFIRIRGRDIDLIEANTLDGYPTEQQKNIKGEPLYWTDETETIPTTDETEYPVTVYQYTENAKMQLFFELDDLTGYYVPRMAWGIGYGQEDPNRGKGFIHKDETGFIFEFINAEGKVASLALNDFADASFRRILSCSIDRANGILTVLQEGESVEDTTTISFVEGTSGIVYTWADGFTTTINFV